MNREHCARYSVFLFANQLYPLLQNMMEGLAVAAGAGFVFGAGLLGQWADRFHHQPLPAIGFLSIAFVLAIYTFTRHLWLGLGLTAVLALGASLIALPMQTVLQSSTQESMRGRVFGYEAHPTCCREVGVSMLI